MHKFLVTFGTKKTIVTAEDLYEAKKKGVQELNVPLTKMWQMDIRLIKNDEVEINTADL